MSRERFLEVMTEAVISLPQDLKAVMRVVEDADVDDESRVATAGSLLHVLSAGNAIPGVRGILQHVGDIVLIQLVLEKVSERSPEAFGQHVEDSPEFFAELSSQLEASRGFLGERISVLEKVAEGLSKQQYQGHSAERCVNDVEMLNWLYGAVHEAIVEKFDYEEDDVARELRNVDRILSSLESRMK